MRLILITLILFIGSCKQVENDWIDKTRHEGLKKLEITAPFEILSTEAKPIGINKTIKNLEESKVYFDKVFNEDLNFAVLFVDNQNWDKYAWAPPPGMPQSYYDGNIVLGIGKSIMASRWEQRLHKLPIQKLDSLRHVFGNEIDLDIFFRDALSLHELGHLYQFYKTSKESQRRWLNEIFGNLCQVASAKNLESKDVFIQMDYFQELLIKENLWGKVEYKTLDQFEESYLEIIKQGRNYGWYQTQFYQIAKELYLKFGDEFLNKFRDLLISIDAKKIGKIENDELIEIIRNNLGDEAVAILKWKHDSYQCVKYS
ncbi:hypothetical protein [uncultured Eudoraea sp.]|uniref:hypothetical protein n=1 Tax=uncultured Eudoraea sp. TaxID=1035614 RepID=UPI00261E1E72|nr:hypothetical protein [uncultured Eudoraea sp.]